MCEAVGLDVIRLRRSALGAVKLGMLQPGQYRELTSQGGGGCGARPPPRGKATATIAKKYGGQRRAPHRGWASHGRARPRALWRQRKKTGEGTEDDRNAPHPGI